MELDCSYRGTPTLRLFLISKKRHDIFFQTPSQRFDNKLVWTAFSVGMLFSILSNTSSVRLLIRSTFRLSLFSNDDDDGDFFMDGIVDEAKGFCGRDMRIGEEMFYTLTTLREKKRCEVFNR